MKLAIISTTVHGEKGYLPFDKLAAKSKFPDVAFIIAGDKGAQLFDTSKFQCPVEYLDPEAQERFHSSETIPWKDPRRRPIAYLRAIETKPDYILTVDDDNIPPEDYFEKWHEVLTAPKNWVAVMPDHDINPPWHNYLRTSDGPIPVYPRGYPTAFRGTHTSEIRAPHSPIAPELVGLFQGISLGDPDIEAMTRIVYEQPIRINNVGEKNYCLRNVWSPYNMQNTVLTKILFPLPILWPHAGRFDDIYASFTWQQLLFNNNMFVHVGDPLNRQDRGTRDIFNKDFKLEVEGYVDAHEVWQQITTICEKDGIGFIKKLVALPHPAIQRERAFFEAYLRDIEKIL